MKFRVVAIVAFLVVTATTLLVRFRDASVVPSEAAKAAAVASSADIPVPPKTGPFGKAVVVGKRTHNFGTMEHGGSGEHSFVLRNEGDGPLKMVARKEDHSCQCTLGSLGKEGLQPGEETTVKLTWEIKNPSSQFQHWAKVRTNDPKKPEITFRVQGLVGHRLMLTPGNQLNLGTLSEQAPTVRTVTLTSEMLDSFKITKLEPSSPFIKIESRPLDAGELKALLEDTEAERMNERMMSESRAMQETADPAAKKAPVVGHEGHSHDKPADEDEDEPLGKKAPVKSGYEITLSVEPKLTVGRFHETVTIETDGEKAEPIVINIDGVRSGPIQILATPGCGWVPSSSLLSMGRFPAAEGKKAKLLVFIDKGPEELKITDVKLDPPTLKYQFVKDQKFTGKGRDKFDLILEVPAGSPIISLAEFNRGSVVLHTNHPDATIIKLELEMTSH